MLGKKILLKAYLPLATTFFLESMKLVKTIIMDLIFLGVS
jgi:hypothetical protein